MHSSIHSVFIKCFSKVFIYLKGREREGFPCHGSLPKCHDKRVRPGWSQESGIPSQIFFLESKRPEDLASSPASQGCVLAGSWTGNRAAKSYTCTLKSTGYLKCLVPYPTTPTVPASVQLWSLPSWCLHSNDGERLYKYLYIHISRSI